MIIARAKYPPNREARVIADNSVNPNFIRLEDWVEGSDGSWKRTKVGGFVRKRETALAFAELLKAVADRLQAADRLSDG